MEGAAARPNETLPQGLIRLPDGRIAPRRSGWLEAGESLRCPFQHLVHPATLLHEGAITIVCKVRPVERAVNCGCLLYVATGAMGFFWADITKDENDAIIKLGIRPTGVARFLGINFPSSGAA